MTRYVYLYGSSHSKEFRRARRCVAKGMAAVRREADWISYRVGIEGQNLGRQRSWLSAKSRAADLLKSKPIGVTIRVVAVKKDGTVVDIVRFRKIAAEPPVKDGPGVVGIDRFESWVRRTYPGARFAGNCVCKSTTSGSHSDHADCAATDWFGTWAQMTAMKDEALRNADYYHTKYVILGSLIYFPGQRPHSYSGVYHSHLHLSVTGGIYNSAC